MSVLYKHRHVALCAFFLLQFSFITIGQVFCPPNFPAGHDCENLCTVCDLNGFTGNSAGYGGDPDGDLSGFCGTVESVQYVGFSPTSPDLIILVSTSNCSVNTGIDLGIMLGCDSEVLQCSPGNGTNTNFLFLSGLTVGGLYTLIIDIDANSPCDYSIITNPSDGAVPANSLPPDLTIVGDNTVCPGATVEYHADHHDYVGTYLWTGPPGTTINGLVPPAYLYESTVTVTWGNTGGNLCVMPFNVCHQGTTACLPVTVAPIPPNIFPDAYVCNEDLPFVLPWGQEVTQSGNYSLTTDSYLGCDSIIKQKVIVLPPKVTNLPPFTLCADDCVTVCGQDFCGYGYYSPVCQSVNGCDSTVYFSIQGPNLQAKILGGDTLTCAQTKVTLNSAPSLGVKTWFNSSGQEISMGNFIEVDTPGTYSLQVVYDVGGHTCTVMDSIKVLRNITPPVVTATNGVACDTVPALLQANASVSPATFSWTGPNGFTSMQQNPSATELGAYIVTATNPVNGCIGKDTAFVTECCLTFAGNMDSTLLTICGEHPQQAGYLYDALLSQGDTLVFILYSNASDPLGSALMFLPTPVFPFIGGVMQLDTTYYAAALATSVLPDSSLDLSGACLALSTREALKWLSKPAITVHSAPSAVCFGSCIDVTFDFTGTAPFQFHYQITQNGTLLIDKTETSNTNQKLITICPSDMIQAIGTGDLNFNVSFLSDARCQCSD